MAGFDQVRPGQPCVVCSADHADAREGLRMTPEWVVNPTEKRQRASETTALSEPGECVPCDGDPG
jgi:hypothetical protein